MDNNNPLAMLQGLMQPPNRVYHETYLSKCQIGDYPVSDKTPLKTIQILDETLRRFDEFDGIIFGQKKYPFWFLL